MPNELNPKAEAVITQIRKLCNLWRTMGNWFNFAIVLFGTATITTSIFVSVYTGSDLVTPSTLKVVAYISTVSLTLLTAFNLITYANNSRKAWRSLNGALMKFETGVYSIKELIDAYQMGEDTMGTMDFNYGPAANSVGQKKTTNTDKEKDVDTSAGEQKEDKAQPDKNNVNTQSKTTDTTTS